MNPFDLLPIELIDKILAQCPKYNTYRVCHKWRKEPLTIQLIYTSDNDLAVMKTIDHNNLYKYSTIAQIMKYKGYLSIVDAIMHNRLDILQYQNKNGITFLKSDIYFAAHLGKLEIFKFLETIIPIDRYMRRNIVNYVIKLENIDMMEYIAQHYPLNDYTLYINAENIDIIKILHKYHNPLHESVLSHYARYGSYDIVEFLLSVNCPVDDMAMTNAAKNKYIRVVKLLHRYNAPVNPSHVTYMNNRDIKIIDLVRSFI